MARDPYEVVLADLRAKRDEIDSLIRSLEAFRPPQGVAAAVKFAAAASVGSPQPTRSDEVGPLYGLSIVDASKIVLRERGRPLPVGDIVTALKEGGHVMNSEEPANTVSSVLNRAFQQGNGVVRVGRGVWALQPQTVEDALAQAALSADVAPETDEDEDIFGGRANPKVRDPLLD